jgi:trimethylamine--corrinoid protein Co-methyltransferase
MEGRIRSWDARQRYEAVPPETIEKIHEATLRILDHTGVRIGSEDVLKRLADAGMNVDFEDGRVRFEPAHVEAMLEKAPSHFLAAARDPDCDLDIGGGRAYLATDGCPADVYDLDTGERRRTTKEDLRQLMVLADALPEIGLVWTAMAANDVPISNRPLHEFHAKLQGTSKHHQQNSTFFPHPARGAVEMARVVAGGEQALRERPIISNFQVCLSPLSWEEGHLDAMTVFADAGIPVGFCCMDLAMASAPASVAGTVVLANTEVVSGMVILETLYPGHPTFYVAFPTSIDARDGNMEAGWGPEELMMQAACQQLARRYQVPTTVGVGGSGAKVQNWQNGLQNGLSAFLAAIQPGDILSDAGTLYDSLIYSFESFLLDTEIFNFLADMWDGYDFSDEAIGRPDIEEVGPGNHYLGQKHTLDHMRDFWMPKYFNRQTWEDWEEAGRPKPQDRAREAVREILATHEPMPLDPAMDSELQRIVASYELADDD